MSEVANNVAAILAEYFPDGLPPSLDTSASAPVRVDDPRPFLDLTRSGGQEVTPRPKRLLAGS